MMGINNILSIQCMLNRMPPRPVASQETHGKGETKYFPRGRASITEPSQISRGKVFKDSRKAAKENPRFCRK